MKNKGFTLYEVIFCLVLTSLIFVFVIEVYPKTTYQSRLEDFRLIALSQNIKTIEQIKDKYYSTGDSINLFKEYTYGGSTYGIGVLYETYVTFEKITFTKDIDNKINGFYKVTYGSDDLAWREGSTSELYRVTVDTTVAGRRLPGTEMTVYLSPVRRR